MFNFLKSKFTNASANSESEELVEEFARQDVRSYPFDLKNFTAGVKFQNADPQAQRAIIVAMLAWIEQHVRTGRKVYIHCAAGMGRSVTLLACWYLYTGSMNVSQVLTFVKRRRPQTSLRRRQVWRIQEIATLLTHTTGKLPVQVSP